MTDSEAAEILDLGPGAYTSEDIAEAANKTQIKTQNACHYAAPVAFHDELIQKLVTVKQARTQLMASAQAGVVRIPASSRRTQSRRPRKSRPAARVGTLLPALAGLWARSATSAKNVLGHVRTVVTAIWLFLCLPFRLLAQRKLLRGSGALILTISVICLAYFFITAGAQGVSSRVMAVSEWCNQMLTGAITEHQDRALPEAAQGTSVQASSLIDVWVDGAKMPGEVAGAPANVPHGTHDVEIRRDGETLYATSLFFPPGGKVRIDGDVALGKRRIVMQIDLPAIRKSDDASHAAGFPVHHAKAVSYYTATHSGLHLARSETDIHPRNAVHQGVSRAALWPALKAQADTPTSHVAQETPRRRVVLDPVMSLLLLPLYFCLVLMDTAIIFVLIRLLTYFTQARPIAFLDDIGSKGVDVLADMVASKTQRWHSRPWTRRQEEAFTLLLLALARIVLGALMGSIF